MKRYVGLLGGLLFFCGLTVNPALAAICDTATIKTRWELVICGGALNERIIEKEAVHNVGVSGDCGSDNESNNPPPMGGGGPSMPYSFGGGWGSQGSGGTPVGGGGTPSLIDPEGCFFPVCSGSTCENETRECTGSSVILSMGTYNTSDTELEVPARAIPVSLERHYRSNLVIPKGTDVSIPLPPLRPYYAIYIEVPLYYGYRSAPGAGEGKLIKKWYCPNSDYQDGCGGGPVPSQELSPSSPTAGSLSESSDAPAFDLPPDGPLGHGWFSPYFVRLHVLNDRRVIYADVSGTFVTFNRDNSGRLVADPETGLSLFETQNGFEVWERGGYIRTFAKDGRLIGIWDRNGNRVTVLYDESGRISRVVDVNERDALSFVYLGDDIHIDQAIDVHGRAVSYFYDSFGNLVRVVDQAGGETTYTYNTYHGMETKTNPVGETYTIDYKFPDRGIVSKVIDPVGTAAIRQGRSAVGHERTFLYDFNGKNFRTIEPDGTEKHKVVNSEGKLLSEFDVALDVKIKDIEYLPERVEKHTDGAGNVMFIQRDEWQNIVKVTDGEGNVSRFTYNDQNKPLTITDPLGVVTKFQYDESGLLLLKKTEAAGTSDEVVTTYVPTEYGEIALITVDGATTSFAYNEQGQLTSVTDALGNVSRTEYDAEGNLTAVIDASGNRTEFTYDDLGNPVTAKDPLGYVTQLAYDAAGRLKSVTDALDRQTKFETDFKERITAIVDALGHRKAFDYDGNGNLVKVTDGDAVTSMTYDGSNRLASITDPEGNTTTYEYAAAGCSSCGGSTAIPESVTDPFGNATNNIFDKNGQIAAIEDPLANLTGLTRDALGRVLGQTDANGNTTNYSYDALGRLSTQTDAIRGVTIFSYDKRGNLLSVTDPEGNTTTFEYDPAGRKRKEIRPMGQVIEYTYYPNGQVATVKDPKEQVSTYTYDEGRLLTAVTYADGSQDLFGYDAAGNMVSWTGASGLSGTITYDELNRKLTETVDYGPFSKTYNYTYDARGNKASYTSPEGIVHDYAYDKNNRPTAIAFDGKTVGLTYEKTRLTQVSFPNGVTSDYSYNANDWLSGIITNGPQGTILTREHTFDKVGNLLAKNTEHGLYSYGYDAAYQLISADNPTLADEAYTYDLVGNRLSSLDVSGTWSYNANNELIGNSQATYEYDANGNTTKKIQGGETTTYVYNLQNRLEKVYLPDGRVATYAYDPFGRRVKKQVGNLVTYYVYAEEGLVGEYDESGALQKAYGWYPDGLWGTYPVYMVDGGSFYFYHADHLGTPQRLTDTSGHVVWSAGYGSFGKASIDPLSTVENNLRFPGQYFDAETGLHYNLNRYFDPASGRYLTTDPFGEGLNPYAYVFGNPVNAFDPLGLFSMCDLHNLLEIAGLIPAFGIIPDLANTLLYLMEGNGKYAILSAVAAIPVVGYVGNLIKHSKKLDRVWDFLKAANKRLGDRGAVGPDISKLTKRVDSKTLRKKWEKETGESWPKDPNNPGRNQDVSHKKPLADGGSNDVDNIEPKPHADHIKDHQEKGDFKRWGSRNNK